MAGSRTRGPVGQSGVPVNLDDGTSARVLMSASGPIGYAATEFARLIRYATTEWNRVAATIAPGGQAGDELEKTIGGQKYASVVIQKGKDFEGKLWGEGDFVGECVSYVRIAGNISSATGDWIAGPRVLDLKEKGLAPGTVIMTTDGKGRYPKGSNPKHAAEFLGFNPDGGIKIREQWAERRNEDGSIKREAQKVRVWDLTIKKSQQSVQSDPRSYYVVLVPALKASAPTPNKK